MYARITTIAFPLETWDDETIRTFSKDNVPEEVRQTPGQRLALWLVDRSRGRGVAIALWDTEEALDATEEGVVRTLRTAAARVGGELETVERFEVAVAAHRLGPPSA